MLRTNSGSGVSFRHTFRKTRYMDSVTFLQLKVEVKVVRLLTMRAAV